MSGLPNVWASSAGSRAYPRLLRTSLRFFAESAALLRFLINFEAKKPGSGRGVGSTEPRPRQLQLLIGLGGEGGVV